MQLKLLRHRRYGLNVRIDTNQKVLVALDQSFEEDRKSAGDFAVDAEHTALVRASLPSITLTSDRPYEQRNEYRKELVTALEAMRKELETLVKEFDEEEAILADMYKLTAAARARAKQAAIKTGRVSEWETFDDGLEDPEEYARDDPEGTHWWTLSGEIDGA